MPKQPPLTNSYSALQRCFDSFDPVFTERLGTYCMVLQLYLLQHEQSSSEGMPILRLLKNDIARATITNWYR